ncbi:MAG: hypothetical protein ACRCUS_06615 [Anaerovoracaceae bacterium]
MNKKYFKVIKRIIISQLIAFALSIYLSSNLPGNLEKQIYVILFLISFILITSTTYIIVFLSKERDLRLGYETEEKSNTEKSKKE